AVQGCVMLYVRQFPGDLLRFAHLDRLECAVAEPTYLEGSLQPHAPHVVAITVRGHRRILLMVGAVRSRDMFTPPGSVARSVGTPPAGRDAASGRRRRRPRRWRDGSARPGRPGTDCQPGSPCRT